MQSKAELLSLQQLRCFCAALELGSFTAAAEALRVSQPAVAEQIRKLEHALGADLFVRAGRGVRGRPRRGARSPSTPRAACARSRTPPTASASSPRSAAGTVAVGMFGEPSAWRLDELVPRSCAAIPTSSVRLVGRNSSAIAERVRRGELEAGVVLLPIDDDKLDVRPIVRDEVLYVSADPPSARAGPPRSSSSPRRRWSSTTPSRPTTTRSGASSPSARRRSACACSPRSRSSSRTSRCGSSPAGIGDTYLPSAYTHAPYYPDGPHTASFSPALYDTFAIVTRPGARLSPGVRELLADLEAHMRAVADELDRSR